MSVHNETESTEAVDTATQESEQLSRIKRYDQRVEEWLTSLKDEAGQRSPEVLSALAAKAQDVADYLNKTAAKARAKSEPPSVIDASKTDDPDAVGPIETKEAK